MGHVLGRSTANGGEPADNPVTMRNLIGTILHTLFDVGELRLRPDATAPSPRSSPESEPTGARSAEGAARPCQSKVRLHPNAGDRT